MSAARRGAPARWAFARAAFLVALTSLPFREVAAQIGPADPSWLSVEGARVTVFHAPGHDELAVRLARFLDGQAPLPALAPGVPTGVNAYLAPDEAAFARQTGGAVPDWSGGVAIPARNEMVIPVYARQTGVSDDRLSVLRHEWAHLGLHQQLGSLRVPRWFDEGYAQWASTWDRSEVWQLRLLLATDRAPPLDSLSLDWPRDAASARAAYLLAATALDYLVEESGERGLALMLERWKASGSFEEALRSTYGVTQGQLEEHWRAYVKRRYGWLSVLSHSVVLWIGFALLLAVLLRVRRRRDRERLARLRATEPSGDPAYWRGEEGTGESPGAGGSG